MTLANNQFKPLINMWMIWLISQPQEKSAQCESV